MEIDVTTIALTDERQSDRSELGSARPKSSGDEELIRAIEALLFAAHEPLPATALMSVNGHSAWQLDDVVAEINLRLEMGRHPMRVRQVAGGYQMHLLPEYGSIVEAVLVKTRTQRLTRAGLETLAIVAYRQPCSTPEIEHIRGVACDGVLRTLLERDLITLKGRSDAPGRPLLYGTTPELLRYFGLNSIDDLPREKELVQILAARQAEGSVSTDASFTPEGGDGSDDADEQHALVLVHSPEGAESIAIPEATVL